MIKLRKAEWLLGAALVLVAATASTTAVAATTHMFSGVDRNGTIHGCFATNGGQLRVIDSRTASCRSDELPLNWSQGGNAAATAPQVQTAHNPGAVTSPVAPTAPSSKQKPVVADTITFTVPPGDSEQVEYFAWGTQGGSSGSIRCNAGGGGGVHGLSPFFVSVDGSLPDPHLDPETLSSITAGTNDTLLFGPGSHTVSLEIVEGFCTTGYTNPPTMSLSNSYLSTTVQATFEN
jgi:hypothetical protein